MKRRRPPQSGFLGSIDSLVDIVANSLGLLVLVSTLAVLGGRGIKIDLGAPIIREAPPGLKRVDVECRGNRVLPIDFDCTEETKKTIWDSPASLEEREAMIKAFNDKRVSSGFHWFELERDSVHGGRMYTDTIVHPLGRAVGDTVADLKAPSSVFRRRLSDLDPNKHFLTFYIRADSFEVFRAVRTLAKEAGFAVGWMPVKHGRPLRFGPGGRRATIDDH